MLNVHNSEAIAIQTVLSANGMPRHTVFAEELHVNRECNGSLEEKEKLTYRDDQIQMRLFCNCPAAGLHYSKIALGQSDQDFRNLLDCGRLP